MKTLRLPFGLRGKQLVPITIGAGAALIAGYIMLLNHEERVMEKYYEKLRATNSELYLSKIMQARGFRTYLKEYLTIHDYSHPVAEVPTFLVGRWALFDKEQRVSDYFVPDSCHKALEIEDGEFKILGDHASDYPARYTMKGTTVTAHLKGAKAASIDVVGYGSHLHHITVQIPGRDHPRYGYMCH